jgi:hypothetical protein
MPKIAIAITTRLRDRGEGLTTLSKEAVTNSIPRQRQLFPRRGRHRPTERSSLPSPARPRWTEPKSPAKEGPSIPMSPTSRLRSISPVVSPGRMFQTPNAFITSFHITYMHTTLTFTSFRIIHFTSFHNIYMHTHAYQVRKHKTSHAS